MKDLYEYIWIDGYGSLRSKTRAVDSEDVYKINLAKRLENLPEWNYDGSSTNQADGSDSEVLLKPVAIYPDPFRSIVGFLVLCETYLPNGEPTKSNTRFKANQIFDKYSSLEPMYGIEQEFFISQNGKVISFLQDGLQPMPQKDYYCGVGGNNIYGRKIIEDAFTNCLQAGLNLTGLNAEVAPAQWEFQVCAVGIAAADQLVMLRYITQRTLELSGYTMDISPKPIQGDWNGSGCHVNYSTKEMREEGGINAIMSGIELLGSKHLECMEQYGSGNRERLTGLHETSDYHKFSYGVANRGCSVRIPRDTEKNGCGYFEDRRPSSNMDPYIVTSLILSYSNK